MKSFIFDLINAISIIFIVLGLSNVQANSVVIDVIPHSKPTSPNEMSIFQIVSRVYLNQAVKGNVRIVTEEKAMITEEQINALVISIK